MMKNRIKATFVAASALVLFGAVAGVAQAKEINVNLGGRLFVDSAALFSRSTTAHSGRMGNGADIGAARLRATGKFGDWEYQLQYDFTGSGAEGIKFAYLQYNGFAGRAIRIGNQFEQFGLENRVSSKYTTFMSQSVPFAAIGVGPRHLGASFTGLNGPVHWGVGVYGDVPGYETSGSSGSQGIDYSARVGFDPVAQRQKVIHVGVSARYHQYGSANTDVGTHNDSVFAAHAGLALSGLFPALIAARAPGSSPDHLTNYNVEFAGVYHALDVQAEYYRAELSGLQGLSSSSATFNGYYGQVAYFLTGESRHFVRTPFYETFVGTHPLNPIDKGGLGAWEIAARYSVADLNDGAFTGGKERDVTVGLNWIPVYHVRFMLDGIRVLPIQKGRNDGAAFSAVAFRTEVFW